MNPVFGSLIENLQGIKIIYEPTVSIFKSDRENTGNSKEYTVQEFVQSYLTSDYRIKKGVIYDRNSNCSQSIDCVILAPNHPKLITPKREIILAEGVYAAIEVKPDISTLTLQSEFNRALTQIKSVKALEREVAKLDLEGLIDNHKLPKYVDKIPGFIFSFKSADPTKMINFIKERYFEGNLQVYHIPDLIVTMDNGLVYFSNEIRSTFLGKFIERYFEQFPDQLFVHIQTQNEKTLVWFVLILLLVTPPDIPMDESILVKYLNPFEFAFSVKLVSLDDNAKIKKIAK